VGEEKRIAFFFFFFFIFIFYYRARLMGVVLPLEWLFFGSDTSIWAKGTAYNDVAYSQGCLRSSRLSGLL
jgi:hypothetical protein